MATSTDTATAARIARVSVATIRAWCRIGRLAATKRHGRWAITPSTLARLLCSPTDRPRIGDRSPALTGRSARRQLDRAAARRIADEHRARVIGHRERARIAYAAAGHTLARDYLHSLGLDEAFVLKYESAFGRATAKVYRANHGAEPDNRGLVVLRGRLWRVNRYRDAADLLAGARAYARTAALVTPAPVRAVALAA